MITLTQIHYITDCWDQYGSTANRAGRLPGHVRPGVSKGAAARARRHAPPARREGRQEVRPHVTRADAPGLHDREHKNFKCHKLSVSK